MSNPTFKPGDQAWHVRHGKVTLFENPGSNTFTLWSYDFLGSYEFFTPTGKAHHSDVGRVLYTLDEARQYGWLSERPALAAGEPRVVEFETDDVVRTESDRGDLFGVEHPLLGQFMGKRVHVTVREVGE